jgi:hypothetical protein
MNHPLSSVGKVHRIRLVSLRALKGRSNLTSRDEIASVAPLLRNDCFSICLGAQQSALDGCLILLAAGYGNI